MSTQSTPQISDFQKINKQKISWLCLSLWNKMVQSSLKWPSGSSRTDKRLTDHLKDNCKQNYDSKENWKWKETITPYLWRILWYKQIIGKVSLTLHAKLFWPFFLILWTSFTPQGMLILLANSHSSFRTVKWFVAWQTNTRNCCFFLLTTLPASKPYW